MDYGWGEEAVHAVVDANLTLRRGQVLGLAGESGSGKSTLAYAATRLLREPGVITGGEVLSPTPRPGQRAPPTCWTWTKATCSGSAGRRSRWSCRAR